jgi:hypothetical protein
MLAPWILFFKPVVDKMYPVSDAPDPEIPVLMHYREVRLRPGMRPPECG